MRNALTLILLLAGALQWSCRLDDLAVDKSNAQIPLVRTVDGWEPLATWTEPRSGGVALHPLIVAALQVLISVLGLVAFSAEFTGGKRQRPSRGVERSGRRQ